MQNRLAFLFLSGVLSVPVFAMPSEDEFSDEQILASLEQRAAEAPDREQCLLYSELIHEMVKYSAGQYASGEVGKATTTLKRTQGFTAKIRGMLGARAKNLKRAQILLRRAAYRLTDLLHMSSADDRKLVQETLAGVEQAERVTLMQVFKN
jgi:hypothetical protein